jgi:hypothetical protein
MRCTLEGLILEVDEMRGNKDKQEDRCDHYVVMKAAALVSPEEITLNRAPDAMHANSVFIVGQFAS